MVFKATFNNISVISLRSALSLEEIEVPGKKHRPAASHWQTLSHNVVHLSKSMLWPNNDDLILAGYHVQHKCHTSRNREIINLYEKETAVIKLNLIQTMWTWWKKIQCFDTDIHCITQSSSVENSRWTLSALSARAKENHKSGFVYAEKLLVFEITTLVVIDTDFTGSCKSNYHTITTTATPCRFWNRLVSCHPQNK
jgi:hypothetical protein